MCPHRQPAERSKETAAEVGGVEPDQRRLETRGHSLELPGRNDGLRFRSLGVQGCRGVGF